VTYSELMRVANGYAESKVLLVANELGVFTAIGAGGRRADRLAKSCGTTREGMTLLLQALAGLGLLRLKAGRYWNTRLGLKFLDGHSPFAVTNLLWLLNHHWSDWTGMSRAVRRGRPGWGLITKTAEFRRRFALAMHERSHVLAPLTIKSFRLPSPAIRFLDLGGGSGSYAIALARRYPGLQGVVVDQSVAVARRLVLREGLAGRIQVRPGNVLTLPLVPGVDAALLSNLLHDFHERENLLLLRRVHRTLRRGGKIFIVEFFLNAAGTMPADAAVFSLLMYAFTAMGRSYTWREVETWLSAVGFGRFRRHMITGSIGTLEAVRL
jgi:SAM-dependent methyltransferase